MGMGIKDGENYQLLVGNFMEALDQGSASYR